MAALNDEGGAGRGGRGAAWRGRAPAERAGENRLGRHGPAYHRSSPACPAPSSWWCRRPTAARYAFMADGRRGRREPARPRAAVPACTPSTKTARACTRLNTTVRRRTAGRGGRGAAGSAAALNEPQWARDGRSIYFMQGGGIYAVAVAGAARRANGAAAARCRGGGGRGGRGGAAASAATGNGAGRRGSAAHQLSRCAWTSTAPAERRQVFEEAWRVMKNRFYDPKMHGVNWAAAKDKYESLLPHVADTRRAAQRHHGDDRRDERLAHRHFGRRPVAGRSAAAPSASRRAIPASRWSPTRRAITRSPTSTARARPTTITSSWRPAISSWRSTARS